MKQKNEQSEPAPTGHRTTRLQYPRDADTISVRRRAAATRLGISDRKLWELTADRRSGIPHFRLGRAVLYPVDALRRWAEEMACKNGGK